jgi:hypothetical protein
MPTAADEPDAVAIVGGWMQRLCDDEVGAEDWAIEALRRYRRQQVPPWLCHREVMLRLKYVAVRVALERRGVL